MMKLGFFSKHIFTERVLILLALVLCLLNSSEVLTVKILGKHFVHYYDYDSKVLEFYKNYFNMIAS